jgi:hypothetical protein
VVPECRGSELNVCLLVVELADRTSARMLVGLDMFLAVALSSENSALCNAVTNDDLRTQRLCATRASYTWVFDSLLWYNLPTAGVARLCAAGINRSK